MEKGKRCKTNIYWPSYIAALAICLVNILNDNCEKTNHIDKNCIKGEIESILQNAIFWESDIPLDVKHRVEAIYKMSGTYAFYGAILEPTETGYLNYGNGILIYQDTYDDNTLVTAIVTEPNENSYQGERFTYQLPGWYVYNMNDEELRQRELKLSKKN